MLQTSAHRRVLRLFALIFFIEATAVFVLPRLPARPAESGPVIESVSLYSEEAAPETPTPRVDEDAPRSPVQQGNPSPFGLPAPAEAKVFLPFYQVATPPRALGDLDVNVPLSARRAGLSGVTVLDIYVNESGTVARAVIFRSSGSGLLDNAARDGALRMRFSPALTSDGSPVPVYIRWPVRFQPE